VRVLVRVDMRKCKALALQELDLGACLGFNLRADLAPRAATAQVKSAEKAGQTVTELAGAWLARLAAGK